MQLLVHIVRIIIFLQNWNNRELSYWSLFFGDLNFILFVFFTLFSTLLIYTNSALHLLLTAELVWITLYALTLLIGFIFDNLNFLSLTFFFLILSAVEFGVGLVLILFQHIMTRTLDFNLDESNLYKYKNDSSQLFYVNQLSWKL